MPLANTASHPLNVVDEKDATVKILFISIFTALLLLSAIIWCVCCGTCLGRELWEMYQRRLVSESNDEDDLREGLLHNRRASYRLDSFNDFILEETELVTLTRQ
jgi:hypothetical protein